MPVIRFEFDTMAPEELIYEAFAFKEGLFTETDETDQQVFKRKIGEYISNTVYRYQVDKAQRAAVVNIEKIVLTKPNIINGK